ncbi:Uncharacterised protein [Vibrio cholerae]|nr:Uncharacterised protein [Vibrio cholerae]
MNMVIILLNHQQICNLFPPTDRFGDLAQKVARHFFL